MVLIQFFLFFLQLVSEFLILEVRPEDNGSFFCSAANPAGVSSANFTVRVAEVTSGDLEVTSDLDDLDDLEGSESEALEEKLSREGESGQVDGDEESMVKVRVYSLISWERVNRATSLGPALRRSLLPFLPH